MGAAKYPSIGQNLLVSLCALDTQGAREVTIVTVASRDRLQAHLEYGTPIFAMALWRT